MIVSDATTFSEFYATRVLVKWVRRTIQRRIQRKLERIPEEDVPDAALLLEAEKLSSRSGADANLNGLVHFDPDTVAPKRKGIPSTLLRALVMLQRPLAVFNRRRVADEQEEAVETAA